MFGWFKKQENTKLDAKSPEASPSDWTQSEAHLLLLSKFRNGDDPVSYSERDYWDNALGEPATSAITRFVQARALQEGTLGQKLDRVFRATELKKLLKARNLKLSGKKAELIQRLLEADESGMARETAAYQLLSCTASGLHLTDAHLKRCDECRRAVEGVIWEALQRRDFNNAVAALVQYESRQVFARGINIHWTSPDDARPEVLQHIFRRTPQLLSGLADDKIEDLRMAAAMDHLWGTNDARKWLPEGFESGHHLRADTAARMLIFHAYFLERVKDWKDMNVTSVKVSVVGDGRTCTFCFAMRDKAFSLESAPEMPLSSCTCEMGCRCSYRIVRP